MATDLKKTAESGDSRLQRIRITLSSSNIPHLQKVCNDLVNSSKKEGMKVKGPVPMPTKILRITTRKTPCGEGSKTWDRYQLRIHKRVIDLFCPSDHVKRLTSVNIDPDVIVEVIVS
ncbi:hypothetical protein ACOME3_001297 [Neoechinorhynchus agilis]